MSTFSGYKSVQRFSLLLLEEGEDYLQEYVVECRWPPEVDGNWGAKAVLSGTLRLCTKSLFFEPDDVRIPVARFPFRFIQHLEPETGKSFTITTSGLTKMKANNANQPYVHLKQSDSRWHFALLYAAFDRFHMLITEQMALKDCEEMLNKRMRERVDGASFDASRLVDFSETILHESAATHVQPLVRETGKLVVTNLRVYFQPLTSVTGFNLVLTHPLEAVGAVARRRSSLRPCGLELFFLPPQEKERVVWDSPCAFFECRSTQERETLMQLFLDKIPPGRIPQGILETEGEWLRRISRAWQFGQISNFDYILYLNLVSGRTFNDLRQWPVFPWVLQDYKSPVLDLYNPDSYRDLSKPIGALNPDRLATFRQRFTQMPPDGFPPPFLYGTHYSTPGYVMFWLVRAAPAHILQLQNGRFDAPDRMFYSVEAAWESVTNNPADVKELIPSFFLPNEEFLTNKFQLALGKRQNGKSVDDVELPEWADCPLDFLAKNRAALESEVVSVNLHLWINLIFGCNQRGEAAIDSDNVFYYLSYEGAVDVEAVKDPLERKGLEAQINEFGQTPKQLFEHPHPPRQIIPPTPDPKTVFEECTKASNSADDSQEGPAPTCQSSDNNQALSLALLSLLTSIAETEITMEDIHAAMSTSCELQPPEEREVPVSVPLGDNRQKSETIYDRVKEEWGFSYSQPTATTMKSTDVRRAFSATVKGLNARMNSFVDSFNSRLMAQPSSHMEVPPQVELETSWCPSLFGGMQLKYSKGFLQGTVRSMAISAQDGGALYCAGDNATLKMFSLENGSQIRSARIERFAGKGIPLSDLDLLPHQKPNLQPLALIGSYDNSVYVYSIEFGRLVGFFTSHDDAVSVVKLMQGPKRPERLITASLDGSVKIWRLRDSRAPWEGHSTQTPDPEIDIADHDSAVTKVAAVSETGVVVSGTREGAIAAWDLSAPHRPLWKTNHSDASVQGLSVLPDGDHILSGYADGSLKLWSMRKPNEIIVAATCPTAVHCCLTDGLVSLHGQENGQIVMWNMGKSLWRNDDIPNQPIPDASGFLPSFECEDSSAVQTLCIERVSTLQGNDVLWLAAGQENGNISLFQSTV